MPQALQSRLRERKCLIAAFAMLDVDNSHRLSYEEFADFCRPPALLTCVDAS